MSRYLRNYLICLAIYAIIAELYGYGVAHHWNVDPFVQVNAVGILGFGGVALFGFGLYGLVEGFWDL